MTEGSTIARICDDKPPAQSPNTRLVAAALAVGFNFGTDAPFMDSFEEGSDTRTVTWVMDGKMTVPFKWVETRDNGSEVIQSEELTFAEFRERYIDIEWVRANQDHPISYMRAAHKKHVVLVNQIKSTPRHQRIKHGKRTLSIPTNLSESERRKWLEQLRK